MQMIRAAAVLLVVNLAAAGVAAAATLYTPIIVRPSQGFQRCLAVNVSAEALTVTVSLVQDTSLVLASRTCTLPAKTGSCDVSDPSVSHAYCKFSTSRPSRALRAAGYGHTASGEVTMALPAH